MVMLRKNYPLYFLNIGRFYPTVKSAVVPFPLDEMLFNTVFITCAHYFIYLKRSLRWYSDFTELKAVKPPLYTAILQVRQLINRLGYACNYFYNFRYFCWKCLFLSFSKLYLLFCYSYKIPYFKLDTSVRNFCPQAVYILPHGVNIRGRHFARGHGYCGMNSVIVTC